jgi:hypothetical protein
MDFNPALFIVLRRPDLSDRSIFNSYRLFISLNRDWEDRLPGERIREKFKAGGAIGSDLPAGSVCIHLF